MKAMPEAPDTSAFERHYRIGELASLWGLGRETVRKLVKDDPGVLKIRCGRKRAHTFYSVPESAARRIHTRLSDQARLGIFTSFGFGLSSKACFRMSVNRDCLSDTHAA